LLKYLRRADEFRDVRAKLLEGGNFPAAKFIPMPLVDSEQFDKEHHRVVFSQAMFIAPLGNGLGEVLIEVRLFCAWHGDYFGGKSKSATDSISV
jgi:hypothetical protein